MSDERQASKPKWIHVRLEGHGTFWVEDAVLRGETDGALAPEEHIRDGKLDYPRCFGGDSYAHVYPEGIMRYHQRIANLSDLKPLDALSSSPLAPTQEGE